MKDRSVLRKDLRASVADGVAFGGMVGFGETYLPAFALAIGLGEIVAGLTASLPLIAGGLLQLVSPFAVRRLRSHRRWVVLCAAVQALTFVPLVFAALQGEIGTAPLLLIASVYWAAGLASGPAWNTWIGTLVHPRVRPDFFAQRSRLCQLAVLIGVTLGGYTLHLAEQHEMQVSAFALLFLLAGGCRCFSVWMLAAHSEPRPVSSTMRSIPWSRVIHHIQSSSGGKLLLYLFAVQAAAQLAGPFFTPFMLEKLRLSYSDLVILLAVSFIAKAFALPAWGRFAKQTGTRQLLQVGGIGIVPISAGWMISQDFFWLCLLQVASGIFWAAFELAFFLLFFESIAEDERTSVLTIYNLLNTTAMVLGAMGGALLLVYFEASYTAYLIVFGLSSLLRLLSLFLLRRVPGLVVQGGEVATRTVSVRPGVASIDAPVLPSMPDLQTES